VAVLQALFFGFVRVGGHLLQVICFEDLIAGQAAKIINAIAPHQEFCVRMFATRHKAGYPLF
jgi:hypothetical protein